MSSEETMAYQTTIQTIFSCLLLMGILCCAHGSDKFMGQRKVTPPNMTTFNPHSAAQMVLEGSIKSGTSFSCVTGNPIDDCWRCDPNWEQNRKRLADCGIGFGKDAIGGKNGKIYVVTDPSDDPVNPSNGTLRHAVIQIEPLWIIFQRDMVIKLKEELMMNSFKTIDGRGANVHIGNNGPCITVQNITNIIIHGIHIHDCKPAGNDLVRDSPFHVGYRQICDGDGISIFTGRYIWVDHCSLSNCADGLIDAVESSTHITISNNYFTQHNEVMLLGHSDSYPQDKIMQVTVAFNHFGEGLIQRMPRCRFGHFQIVNNDYTEWGDYAIGGSANPTILSQGNRFLASANPFTKDVTRRENIVSVNEWKQWNWKSEDDMLLNSANFTQSGSQQSKDYAAAYSVRPRSSVFVGNLTRNAGVISCRRGSICL